MFCYRNYVQRRLRKSSTRTIVMMLVAAFVCAGAAKSRAQAAAPAPDVLTLANGDQLTGKLLREAAGTVTFHSDMIGDVTVAWDKIKSIQSSQKFAVIEQGQHVTRKTASSQVAQGTVQVADDQVTISPAAQGAAKELATKNVQYIIDEPTFAREVEHSPGFTYGWTGSITAAATLIQATQNSHSFGGAVALIRTIPTVNWLDPRNRTIIDFNGTNGSVSQPGTTTTKTNIIHFDAEHDWYVTPRFYFLVDTAFDHNYSQGLQLQQLYGAGAGYTLIKTPKQELDLKADVHFERQTFFVTPGIQPPPPLTPSKNLIGMDFGDVYMYKLVHGVVFNQGATITPAFNNTNAWSAVATAGLLFPTYKRLGFSLGVLDNYLNDPAAGSKKNSFQFTAGVTYTLK
ncbi:MAG TPA: DUF481 domain-containing protein [Acidobacteriaceae bacterium]|nr:DUF481 domain-containing protein [Acidobacteriaceae bacterium]